MSIGDHNHFLGPSRDDCPRCIRIRKILSPAKAPGLRCEKGHTDITVICGRCGDPLPAVNGGCCNTIHPPIYFCGDCERDVEVTSESESA
jgi:hypothetical protein